MYYGIQSIFGSSDKDRTPILDRYPGAEFAISKRRLITGFNDPAYTITNESSLLTFDKQPLDKKSEVQGAKDEILSFAPGVKAKLAKWWDQSGNARDLVITTVTNQWEAKDELDNFFSDEKGDFAFSYTADSRGTYTVNDPSITDLRSTGGTIFVASGRNGIGGCRPFFEWKGVFLWDGDEAGVHTLASAGVVNSKFGIEGNPSINRVFAAKIFPDNTCELSMNGESPVVEPWTAPDNQPGDLQDRFRLGRAINTLPYPNIYEILVYPTLLDDPTIHSILNDLRAYYVGI